MRIIVTGGAGFIGVNLARLFGEAHEFVAFDNLSIGRESDARTNGYASLLVGDIRDGERLATCFEGADAVVHLAAQTGVGPSLNDPWHDLDVNVVGTYRVLEAARDAQISRVVLASSGAPLGDAPSPLSEAAVPRPLSPYGASKLALEAYGSAFAHSFGVPTTTLRFSNVYGPWSYLKGSVVARWMNDLGQGAPITINGDGSQTRDFVHVDDICHAIMLAIGSSNGSGLFQLGTGIETSVFELATAMIDIWELDMLDSVVYGERHPADVQRSFSDISNARAALGWEPRIALGEGLEETRRWFAQHGSELA